MKRFTFLICLLGCGYLFAQKINSSWPSGKDLTIDLVATNPEIEQPIFLNFDHRGRMWVNQFRQYPFPAGAELIGRDRFWRNEYDRAIPPPGHPDYVPGRDRITIHEDSNGDGSFDKISTFLDGLNFCTSFAHDHNGLWVLQPPYLLFYEDKNHDDLPDGPPQVHLRGFGIEDSHSLANSLTWGPDGWLYGANGSTTSVKVTVEGSKAPPVIRQGQLVWRYHPRKKIFEIFAEGGGNNLSCEFDSAGRLYSGSNTGDAAFYYHQGAYYQKTFGKHGAHSNPHTYGYLPGIAHQKYARVTNSIIIYEGGELPARFEDALVFANPLTLGLGSYRLTPTDLNFKTIPNGIVEVRKDDPWFCPVYVDAGPDGALYLCDWYDQQCNHYLNSEGKISAYDGRIFRIRSRQSEHLKPFDLSKASVPELLEQLKSKNRWWRESARLILRHHKHREQALPIIQDWISHENRQLALEGLWVGNLIKDVSLPVFREALAHENPHVRRWAIRLAVDEETLSPAHLEAIQVLLERESDLEVLAQVASSTGRLPQDQAFPLFSTLLKSGHLSKNPSLSLLTWWAIERHFEKFPSECLALLDDEEIKAPRVLSFLARRCLDDGSHQNLLFCSPLVLRVGKFNPLDQAHFWEQFEAGIEGQSLAKFPENLLKVMAGQKNLPLYLKLRIPEKFPKARSQAQALLKKGEKGNRKTLLRVTEFFGDFPSPESTPLLLDLLSSKDEEILIQTLGSLQNIDSPKIGEAVLTRIKTFPPSSRKAASVLLLSRIQWTNQWLNAASQDEDLKSLLTPEVRNQIINGKVPGRLGKLAGLFTGPVTEGSLVLGPSFEEEIARLRSVLEKNHKPDLQNGYQLFTTRCATCHVLHSQGGNIGPVLTSYQRDDLKTLLPAIVNPGAEIREGFETYTLKTRDGRTLVGFLKSQNKRLVILQPPAGISASIARDQILSLEPSETSLMPAGLLAGLSDQEITNLFAYLRSAQPLNLKK